MWPIIFKYRWHKLQRYFSRQTLARVLTAVIFILILLAVAWGVFSFSKQGFQFILRDPYFAQAMQYYVFQLFFLAIFFLVLVSAVISSCVGLFSRGGDDWIAVSPNFSYLIRRAASRVWSSSLWPIIFLTLPLLLGRFAASSGGASSVLLPFLVVILSTLSVCFSATVGVFILAMVLSWLGNLSKKIVLTKNTLAVFSILVLIILSVFTLKQVTSLDMVALFSNYRVPLAMRLSATSDEAARELLTSQASQTANASVDVIRKIFSVFPSAPAAEIIYRNFEPIESAAPWKIWLGLYPILINLVIPVIFLFFAGRAYLYLWQKMAEGEGRPVRRSGTNLLAKAKTPLTALSRAELIRSIRNIRSLIWAIFLIFLWIFQSGLNLLLRRNFHRYHVTPGDIPQIVPALEIVTVIFFVSALVLRFVLPTMSMERKNAWLLGSAPVSPRRIFMAKLIFFAPILLGLTVIISFANSIILGMSIWKWPMFISFTLLSAGTVLVTGLSCGAAWPNFETDDPEVISTSFVGLSFAALSLLYAGGCAYAYYMFWIYGDFWPTVFAGIASVVAVCVCLASAFKKMSKLEYAPGV